MNQRLISSQDKARAAKALVYVAHISPSARRVGLALLDHLNVTTLQCDPGEARLAAMLHITERAVRNAKNQLKRVGFLNWKNHGSARITNDYRLNFIALHAVCDRIEEEARLLLPRRRRASDRNDCSGVEETGQTGTLEHETGTPVPQRPEHQFRQTYPLNSPIELYQEALKEEG